MKTPSSRTGVWAVAIGAILAGPVLLVLLAIAIPIILPQGLRLRKTANQTSALRTMRAIGQAETAYNASYPDQGFACPLETLGGYPKSAPPSPTAAQIIDPALASTGRKSGYTFSIACGKPILVNQRQIHTSYHIYAVPDSAGRTGDNGYCADEANIIHVDPAGGTNCAQNQ